MRFLSALLFALCVLISCPSEAVITLVQRAGSLSTATTSAMLSTTISASALHDLLVVVPYNDHNSTISGVTDNKSQTWVQVPSAARNNGNNCALDMWYFAGTASGVTTVTVTYSAAGGAYTGSQGQSVYEVSGIGASPIDSSTNGTTTGANAATTIISGASLTTTNAADMIIVGGCIDVNGAAQPTITSLTTPYTLGAQQQNTGNLVTYGDGYQITSSTVTSQKATFNGTHLGNGTTASEFNAAGFKAGTFATAVTGPMGAIFP